MEDTIQKILNDLYAMDPEFKNHEQELKEIISEMLQAKPDTKFDETFAKKLKMRLLVPKKPAAPAVTGTFMDRFVGFFKTPYIGLAAVAAVLLLILIGWKGFSGKPPVPAEFTLKATVQDGAGVDPHTSFTLRSTQSLSEKQIRQIVTFQPEINFSVKPVASGSTLFKQALAAEGQGGPYVYELIPSDGLRAETVYQAAITDKQYATRAYAWAFQVKAPFAVIKTHPGNKTTYVPTNTGIEMTFNRTNIQNIDQHFQISPAAPGRFEVYDDTAVFIPKDGLKEKTVYTVTVSKGLTGKGSGDSLQNDYVFSFETSGSYEQQNSYLSFTNDFVEALPGIKTDLGVYTGSANPAGVQVNVYQINNPDEFLSLYQDSRNWGWGWTTFYRQSNPNSFDPKGKKPVVSFQPQIVAQNYQSYLEIPQVLDPGMYVVDASLGGQHTQAWLQITRSAHYLSVTHDTSLLWLYDFSGNVPQKNSQVQFVQSGSQSQNLGSTNGDGLAQFSTPTALQSENSQQNTNPSFFKVTDQSNNVTWVKIQDQWGYGPAGANQGDNYWKFISTDRYTYQMTDTVKFWGVAKSRKEDIRQKKVTVALYDSSRFWDYGQSLNKQQPIVSTDVLISPFNTIEGSFSFKGLDPKTYILAVTLGDETISQSAIEVLTYSKPSYQLTVTASKPAIFAGDSVTFTVKGSFFDGTPLSGTTINYNGYWNNSLQGQVTLDSNGEANVTVTPEYPDNNYNAYYPRDLSLTFTPASGEEGEISGNGDVLVFGPHMYLQGNQEHQSGDNYTFKAKLNDIDINNQVPDDNGGFRTEYIGNPVAGYPITATVTKTTYTKQETGDYYDPINKVVNKTYQYIRSDEVIDTIQGNTNNNGEWQFTKNLPKSDYSYYTVAFTATDRQGRSMSATAYAYYASYDTWRPAGLSLSIGSDSYEKDFSVGEPVNLAVQGNGDLNVSGKPILYYRYQNSISKAVIQTSDAFSENFGADFLPSVQYRAVTVGPYGFEESNAVFATFKKDDNNVKLSITTDKDNYRPGDKVAIKLHATDKNGQPISAETNVAIVDEAVFHVLPYNWQQQLLDSLYQPIYTSPITDATHYLLPENGGGGGGAEKGGCFTAGTQILLASGKTKSIEDIQVGDQILSFDDTAHKKLVPAIVQGNSSHTVDDFLRINALEVTPEHQIFLNGQWDYAGNAKIGDTLTLPDGNHQIIRSITHVRAPKTLVYNIVVGHYHTYFADGYFVHNAEKGGTSVRDNFVDTASFQTVHTDGSGNAELSFTAPDNITSWRVTARIFDNNTLKAGEQTKLVPATLPLFVNAVLNENYLVDDNPQIKIGVYGTDYHADQDTVANIQSDAVHLNKTITIRNHVGYLDVGKLPEGQFDITISAHQGNLNDALKKSITVAKSYFTKPVIASQLLQNGHVSISGNAGSFTTVEFMDAGKGKYYQDLLQLSYSGGVRLDQTLSSYYATKILNDFFRQNQPQEKLDLSAYQNTYGQPAANGFRLFPYSDTDLELSAKVADLAADYVSGNDLGDYFSAALHDTKTDLHRSAVALYGLASLQKPVLTRLQDLASQKDLAWQDKLYVALGMYKLGDGEEARALYEQDIRSHLRFDGPQAWFDSETSPTQKVKLTDLAGILAANLGIQDDTSQIWNYMDSHAPEKDLDVLEKTLFIKAAVAQANQQEAKFSFQAGNKKQDVTLKNGDVSSFAFSSDELGSLTISNLSGSVMAVSHYEQTRDPQSLAKDSNLGITRKFTVGNKATTNFHDGDVVRVMLYPKIQKNALDGDYQVVDILPSGLKPITDPYTYGVDQGSYCLSYPQKIVGNKVYFTVPKDMTYYNYGGCESGAIQYNARVVTKGTFTASPTLLQSVLNPDDLNISDSPTITVN